MADGALEELLSRLRLNAQQQGDDATVERPPKVLDDLTLDGVVKHIRKVEASENKRKIVVMTGAGISTAAGIPDFRSPDTGLYDNLQKYDLPNPQSVFEIGYFRYNPKPFFHLARELYPGNFKPTLSHYFIRLLAEKGLLLRNFTQNIDTLERRAGIDPDLLMEAHGQFMTAHCIDCGQEYPHQFVKDRVFDGEIPLCTKPGCAKVPPKEQQDSEPYHGVVKPDIVFFGEALPERFAKCAVQDTKDCELLLIMGTSLVVQPFASLVDRVPDNCPRLLINLEKAGQGHPLMKMLGMGSGLDFSVETGYRDVFVKNTCDEGCKDLARKLGWEDELMKMFKEDHARLDAIMETEKSGVASGVKPEEGERKVVPREEMKAGETEDGERKVVPCEEMKAGETEDGERKVVPLEETKPGGEQSTATGKSDDST